MCFRRGRRKATVSSRQACPKILCFTKHETHCLILCRNNLLPKTLLLSYLKYYSEWEKSKLLITLLTGFFTKSRLECQCWKNSKYSRHEYIEIVEIPDTINN